MRGSEIVGGDDAEMTEAEALRRARELFLRTDSHNGCAEVTLLVLQEAFNPDGKADPSPALALNGGVAWQGKVCGALTGAAVAWGILAARRMPYGDAKQYARETIARLMGDFESRFGSVNCRDLTGWDIRTEEQHAAFVEEGAWRETCMRQVEFVVRRMFQEGR
jgi:C_GCAxxG_C_C family probable redox protein